MSAHSALALLAEIPAADGRVLATLRLACGCVVERNIAADRILQAEDGRRFAIGKYACPVGHPVRPPAP